MIKNILGLSEEDVKKSREKYGANIFQREKSKGFFRRFLENLNDPIIKILIIALAIEIIFTLGRCNYFEVGGIVLAILIATVVSTASEYGSEKAFEKMRSGGAGGTVRVLRGSGIVELPSEELVVGDIVYVSAGERIPADGVLISGRLSVDQSALNGESRETSKYPCADDGEWSLSSKNKVYSGTEVTLGDGVIKIGRVGSDTYYGMIAKDVQAPTRESPLKIRLSALAAGISKIGYIMAGAVGFFYLFNSIAVDNGFDFSRILGFVTDVSKIIPVLTHALTLMITVVVVAVPEGLPMMITVILSANMKKMLKDNVLVKKLVGIETAGSLNILFTDKTGTVTVGEPNCERIIAQDAVYKSMTALRAAKALHTMLTVSAFYNTESSLNGNKVIGGNGTDRAITGYFKSEKAPFMKVKSKESFTSDKKCSKVVFANGQEYIKGAPEIIISAAKYALNSQGKVVNFNREEIERRLRETSSHGNRVIGVAYKEKDGDGYIFVALIVLRDILRRDTTRAIAEMQKAGVQIVMMTGDGKETAVAIARECGILGKRDDEIVLTSSELSAMSDDEVKAVIPKLRVLARALPQDKTRLVRLSQQMQLVVGMTGDGINDAPSLKLADVGFAMGSGTDIAKGAGDIIILNNSMYAINRTILYGRTIFKSIRKFITFQLVMNLAACGVSLVGQLIGIETPITIIQMLWVNIIMDTLGGLAFAGEPALEYYMKEKPKRRDEPILDSSLICRILVMGAYTLGLCVFFLCSDRIKGAFVGANSEIRFLTAFYALFIFLGIFNSFCARSERMWFLSSIEKNKPFIFVMLLISLIQLLMIYYGGELFRSAPLSARELSTVILSAFSVILFDAVRRIYVKLRAKKE